MRPAFRILFFMVAAFILATISNQLYLIGYELWIAVGVFVVAVSFMVVAFVDWFWRIGGLK